MGHQHGQLRKRRGVLPLQLQRRPWLRPHSTRRCIRASLPPDSKGADVRHVTAEAQDSKDENLSDLVPEVTWTMNLKTQQDEHILDEHSKLFHLTISKVVVLIKNKAIASQAARRGSTSHLGIFESNAL